MPTYKGQFSPSNSLLFETLRVLLFIYGGPGPQELRFPGAIRAISDETSPGLSLSRGKLRLSGNSRQEQTRGFLRLVENMSTPEGFVNRRLEETAINFLIYTGMSHAFREELARHNEFAPEVISKVTTILNAVEKAAGRSIPKTSSAPPRAEMRKRPEAPVEESKHFAEGRRQVRGRCLAGQLFLVFSN